MSTHYSEWTQPAGIEPNPGQVRTLTPTAHSLSGPIAGGLNTVEAVEACTRDYFGKTGIPTDHPLTVKLL